ncbi:hypothetical protein [Serpentinicella alkaliphila]|uniref:Uncharacterized protein n=1 Tax=Serpentinicella alkaliphila TaxID=1734049 RepID=A0A4R2TQS3_9FIRM|nr:hypothetical protein [Serpentinicella alkaliphila]QUH25585.1 hypothetical protein HZR23_07430 [Serpentinicella alkaliphila]TCP97362.1 hypothetical protein EDD79_10463 [Serpentinicella alkaliphila]
MSLFLGKIHYWLYNKIVSYELIEKEIIKWASEKGLNLEDLIRSTYAEFGAPLDNRPLEDIIDTSNIHGWLQNKINNAELRQAALITNILNRDKSFKEELMEVFKEQGIVAAKKYNGHSPDTPETMYNFLSDVLLEGMPCDRVSDILDNNDHEFIWVTTMCLHKPYWEKVGGDVKNFYDLRDVWIKYFVQSLNPKFNYERAADGVQKIKRV